MDQEALFRWPLRLRFRRIRDFSDSFRARLYFSHLRQKGVGYADPLSAQREAIAAPTSCTDLIEGRCYSLVSLSYLGVPCLVGAKPRVSMPPLSEIYSALRQ